LIAVEIFARVTWPDGPWWRLVRWGGLLPVALLAAFVSYRHLSGLLAHYGEDPLVQHFGPLAVDGLMVMATGALLATGHPRTITEATHTPTTAVTPNGPGRPTQHEDQAAVMPAVVDPDPVPAHLLPGARFAATNHEYTTGQPITPDELAARIGITPAVAGQLLTHLGQPARPAGRVNGTAITGGAR
jgi:hypothetical protein